MSSSSTERKLSLKEAWPYQTRLLSLSRGIMVGPRANWLLTGIVYSYMLFTTVLMFGSVLPPLDGGIISTLFWAMGMTGCASQWYFACCCSFVDPGIMPRDWMIKDQPRTKYTEKLLLPEGANCDHVCRTCNIVRPLKSHHCSMCDHCVVGFDHHCAWLGVCIGLRNRKFFLLLLTTCVANCTLSPIAGAYRMYLDYDPASATLLGHSSLLYILYAYLLLFVIVYGALIQRYGHLAVACKYGGAALFLFCVARAYFLVTPENPLLGSTLAGYWMVVGKLSLGLVFYLFTFATYNTLAAGSTTKEAMRIMSGKPAKVPVTIEDGVQYNWWDVQSKLFEVRLNPFVASLMDTIIACAQLQPFPRAQVLRTFFARETVPSLLPYDATYSPRQIPKPKPRDRKKSHKTADDPLMLLPCCKEPNPEVYNYTVPQDLPTQRMYTAPHGTCQHSHANGGGHGHSHDQYRHGSHGHGEHGGHGHSHGGDDGHGHSHGGEATPAVDPESAYPALRAMGAMAAAQATASSADAGTTTQPTPSPVVGGGFGGGFEDFHLGGGDTNDSYGFSDGANAAAGPTPAQQRSAAHAPAPAPPNSSGPPSSGSSSVEDDSDAPPLMVTDDADGSFDDVQLPFGMGMPAMMAQARRQNGL